MPITVSEARTSFALRKKDISDVSADLFLEWMNYANRFAYRLLTNVDPERFMTSSVITVQSNQNTYSLPADFNNIHPIGAGIYEIDNNGDDTWNRLARTGFAYQRYGYYMTASSIVFTPIPTKVQSYRLRYIPNLTDLSGDDSETVIPDEYMEHMVNALDVMYTVWDEDQNAEITADSRFIRTMYELVGNYRHEPHTIGDRDFSVIF